MNERIVPLTTRARRPILACGADVKGAYAFAQGAAAYVVDGFGDLQDPDNLSRYENSIEEHIRSLKVAPQAVVCDLHPGYFSTHVAERYERSALRAHPRSRCALYRVQHHEAHVASCVADHGVRGDVIGVAFDGTGYGDDGKIWGGEFFVGNLVRLARAGHLGYVPMPGGERAVREPWRMAAVYLWGAFGDRFTALPIDFVKRMDVEKWKIMRTMIRKGIQAPLTSSAGRLFDAAASIILLKDVVSREAEGPMALERSAERGVRGFYDFRIRKDGNVFVADAAKIIQGVVKDLSRREARSVIASKFHNTIALVIVSMCVHVRRRYGVNKVVLSGGVFQNSFLLKRAQELFGKHKFRVYAASKVPANDHGIPLGQVAIANARFERRCA